MAGVAGLAGCIGEGPGGEGAEPTPEGGTPAGDAGGTTTGTSGGAAGATTVQWAADALAGDNADGIQQALYDAGLSQNIELDIIPGDWETERRKDQYQQWLSAGRSNPDMLMMDGGWQQAFIVRGQCANLNEVLGDDVTSTVEDQYLDLAVASATGPDGALYGVPLFVDIPTVQYRKDLVTDAGYDPSNWATEPLSWQRFAEITADVQEQAGTEYGFTFQAKAYEGLACCDFNEWLSSWGGAFFGPLDNLFGPVGDRPVTVNEPPVANSLRMIRSFLYGSDDQEALDGYAGPIAPQAVLQWTEETSRQPFTGGNAVMHRNWPYSIVENGKEEAFGEDLGVMPIPYGVPPEEAKYEGTGGTASALGGWNIAVNPNADDTDAVAEVLGAMTDDGFQLALFKQIGWTPPKPELIGSDEARNVSVIGRYVDTIQVGAENAIPRPATAVWPQQSTKVSQQVNATLSQQAPVQQALDQLAETIETIEQSG